MRIKKGAHVEVEIEGGKIIGEKDAFSARDEKHALILRNPNHKESKLSSVGGAILLTEASNIKNIIVKENAFNKHEDILSHSAQATYLALLAVGFSLIALSISITFNYFELKLPVEVVSLVQTKHANWFSYLTKFYEYFWYPLWVITLLFVCASIYTLQADFKSFYSSFILCPELSAILLLLTSYVVFMLSYFLNSHDESVGWICDDIVQILWKAILIFAVAASLCIYVKQNSLNNRIKTFINTSSEN